MPRDERHDRGDAGGLPDMNADDVLDGVTTADGIDDGEVVETGSESVEDDGGIDGLEVDMNAGDAAGVDPVENSDGVIVARPVGLEALADPEDGQYACTVCDARSGDSHGAKVHFGAAGHTAADIEDTGDDGEGDIVTPDETPDEEDWSGMAIDTITDGDDDGSVDDGETTWGDVRDAYANARVQASPVTRNDARDRVVAVLEAETEWMSIVERCNETTYDLWYLTDDGWDEDGYKHCETRMRTELGAIASDTEVGHIVAQLATLNYVEQDNTNAKHLDETLIPVKNGVINVDDIEYDPATMTIDWDTVTVQDMEPNRHRFIYRIQTDWDPENADLEGLDKWLETITRTDEARRIIWEFAGHSIHPRYPVDGMLIFLGDGGSGKSQTLEVLKAMLGPDNTSVKTMTDIQDGRFDGKDVVDSRANINTELTGTKFQSINKIKTYTAGEEDSVEGKGTAAFKSPNDATMLFASDDPPSFPANRALGRRLYPIEFPYSYVSDPDPSNPYELQSKSKLVVQEELQADERLKAALMRAVQGLVRILRDGEFSSEKAWEERVAQYESYADPIHDFARNALTADGESAIETSDLKATFDAFADAKGHDGKKMNQIVDILEEMPAYPLSKDRTRTFADDREKHTVYKNIAFTDDAREHWVPESAYWSQYGGRPGAEISKDDGDEFEGVDLAEITDPGRYDAVKVKVASVEDEPAPWLHDQGVVVDGSHSLRYEVQSGISLDEGETYVLRDVIVAEDEADVKLQLINGMTDVFRIEERDEEQDAAVEDSETGDVPGYVGDGVMDVINDREDVEEDGETSSEGDSDESDPDKPASRMSRHHVQCRECGYWGPVVGFLGGCSRCGAELDSEWNMNERTLTEEALRTAKVQDTIVRLEEQHDEGAPIDDVYTSVEDRGVDHLQAEHCIDKLRHKGKVYEPATGHLRTT